MSQEKAAARGSEILNPEYAAKLVKTSLENGADGFMFSISETTLSILRILSEEYTGKSLRLYAITPAAGESARKMGSMGGIEGIVKKAAKQMLTSGNLKAIFLGLRGAISMNPEALLHSYLHNEISKVKSSAGKRAILGSIMLHEIVTDLALALDIEWLFLSYIDFFNNLGIVPGFETRNFVYLANRFREWNIDFREIMIAAPFNEVGFQMTPSKVECEQALTSLHEPNVVAISILASGYLNLPEATKYIKSLPNVKGCAVGISKERHAYETFKFLKERL